MIAKVLSISSRFFRHNLLEIKLLSFICILFVADSAEIGSQPKRYRLLPQHIGFIRYCFIVLQLKRRQRPLTTLRGSMLVVNVFIDFLLLPRKLKSILDIYIANHNLIKLPDSPRSINRILPRISLQIHRWFSWGIGFKCEEVSLIKYGTITGFLLLYTTIMRHLLTNHIKSWIAGSRPVLILITIPILSTIFLYWIVHRSLLAPAPAPLPSRRLPPTPMPHPRFMKNPLTVITGIAASGAEVAFAVVFQFFLRHSMIGREAGGWFGGFGGVGYPPLALTARLLLYRFGALFRLLAAAAASDYLWRPDEEVDVIVGGVTPLMIRRLLLKLLPRNNRRLLLARRRNRIAPRRPRHHISLLFPATRYLHFDLPLVY